MSNSQSKMERKIERGGVLRALQYQEVYTFVLKKWQDQNGKSMDTSDLKWVAEEAGRITDYLLEKQKTTA